MCAYYRLMEIPPHLRDKRIVCNDDERIMIQKDPRSCPPSAPGPSPPWAKGQQPWPTPLTIENHVRTTLREKKHILKQNRTGTCVSLNWNLCQWFHPVFSGLQMIPGFHPQFDIANVSRFAVGKLIYIYQWAKASNSISGPRLPVSKPWNYWRICLPIKFPHISYNLRLNIY